MPDLTADQRLLVEYLWNHLMEKGAWPRRREVEIWLDDSEKDFNFQAWAAPAIRMESESDPFVRPTFDAVLELEPARALLEPLPKVARLAAQRFIEKPSYINDSDKPKVEASELIRLWRDEATGLRALEILKQAHLPFLDTIWRSSEGDFFWIPLKSLRFEKVTTLDDVLALRSNPKPTKVDNLQPGVHLEFLERVFRHLVEHKDWPIPLAFAVEHRKSLGYVPQLHQELSPRFVLHDFSQRRDDRIELTLRALPLVDHSGEYRELAMRLIRLIRQRFKSLQQEQPISGAELAAALQIPMASVAVGLHLIWHERWWSSLSRDGDPARWTVIPAPSVLTNGKEQLESFDAYLRYWYEEPDQKRPPVKLVKQPEPAPPREEKPATHDQAALQALKKIGSVLKQERYRNLVARDTAELKRVLDAGALKSAMLLAGSLIEAVLLDVLDRNPPVAERWLHKKKNRKWPRDAGLMDLISLAREEELIDERVVTLAMPLKDFRDHIHPFREAQTPLKPGFLPLVLDLLALVLGELHEATENDKVTKYQQRPAPGA